MKNLSQHRSGSTEKMLTKSFSEYTWNHVVLRKIKSKTTLNLSIRQKEFGFVGCKMNKVGLGILKLKGHIEGEKENA